MLHVLLAVVMMNRSISRKMRRRAQLQDDGQLVIVARVVVATVASLVAIAGTLVVSKDMHGFLKSAHIALARGWPSSSCTLALDTTWQTEK